MTPATGFRFSYNIFGIDSLASFTEACRGGFGGCGPFAPVIQRLRRE